MTEAEFNALAAQGYNRIPVTLQTFSDLDTPLSVYLKLANAPNSYLLESVQGGERFGRYSFIGLPAKRRIEVRIGDNGPETIVKEAGKTVETLEGNPLDAIEAGKIPAEFAAKDKKYFVYCRSGVRSAKAADALASYGYKDILDFGGIIDWPYEVTR